MADAQRRKISELRVVDLRHELEKRGLDKAGNKGVLLDRLVQALSAEGKNCEYLDNAVDSNLNLSAGDSQDSSNGDRSTLGEKETKNDESMDDTKVSVSNDAPGGDSSGNGTDIKTDGSDGVEKQNPDEDDKELQGLPMSDFLEDGEDQDLDEEDVENDEEEILDHDEDIIDHGESDVPDQKEEASDSEERVLDDDSQGALGSEDLDGPTVAPDELSIDGSQTHDVPDEKAEVIDETPTKDTASENSGKDSIKASKEITCDDETDQDALRLTIGEEEEEDKNYILADEREKDKSDLEPEKHHVKQSENSKTAKATPSKAKPSLKSKGSSKTAKSASGSKVESGKVSESKEDKSKSEVSSRTTKSNGGTDANSGNKDVNKDTAKTAGQKKHQDSEKIVPKHDAKEGTSGSQKNESHRERSRPVRRHDRTRMPFDSRPVKRSGSPRRAVSNHRQTLSFEHIREMRERERQREREREMHRRIRERERREREEIARQREIERRNAEQLELLERERQRLRIEREKVEREKEELIRMERERQRAERERIEREKEEIRRAKLDERSRRGQKRSFEDDRKEPSPRDYGERKRIVVDNRRPERATYPEPERAIRSAAASSSTRDHERLHRRRSKSRSPSVGRHHSTHRRELGRPAGRSVPYPDREPVAQDWRYKESRRDVHYRPKEAHKPYPEVSKEKRVEERREVRIARDRETIIPSTGTMRVAVPDYSSRIDSGLSTHRSAVQVTSKARPDRYDSVKSDPYALAKEDTWSSRANYGSSSASATSFPNSMSSRDIWQDRKSDYISSERLAVRPSISDAPDRWISGSGAALGGTRSVMSSDHMPQVPPPPTFGHTSGPVTGSGSGSVRMYQSDPYGASAYSSKSRFPAQRY